MAFINQNISRLRKSGTTTVGTTAVAVTDIGASLGSPTFARNQVSGSGWDLSGVLVGDVVVSSDGYGGVVTAIDDTNDILSIGEGWQHPDGSLRHPLTNVYPVAGGTIKVHRIARCRRMLIKAAAANGQIIYIGQHGTATTGDYPLAGGEKLPLEGWEKKEIDMTQVFAIAASGSQSLSWIVDGIG